MNQNASITFYGGANTVTGANFLLDIGDKKILIDCGVLQRASSSNEKCDTANATPFLYDPSTVDALIVTHAHADHIGRIPKLVRDGFKGEIYSTRATRDLATIMFEDALSIMQSAQEKHDCVPLYEKGDVDAMLALWQVREYHESFGIGSALIELFDAGHILGSAMVKMTRQHGSSVSGSLSGVATPALPRGTSRCETPGNTASVLSPRAILFTGDLGNSPEPLLNDTEIPEGVNYLVMESVYGDRVHEGRERRREILRTAITDAQACKGTLLIPSFSLERTQILLFEMSRMVERGELSALSVFLDSPLAIRATDVFRRYTQLLNADVQSRFTDGADAFSFPGLRMTATSAQAHTIHSAPDPKIIIAGAGMSVGGRIRAHEARYLPDKNASILFVGYQTPGSLGRRIQDGSKEVTIDGTQVQVRAKIQSLTGYSGHRDRDGLLDFVERLGSTLERVFVAMGEPKAEMFLSQRIRDFLGVRADVPKSQENIMIDC